MSDPRDDRSVDVAVIGAGTAGLAAHRAAAALVPNAVLIESGVHGTTCARVGCMPSKLLIAAADAAHQARVADPFGVRCTVAIDRRAVMDRVRRERDRFVGLVVEGVAAIPAEHLLEGLARFVAPGVLEVGSTRLRARAVVVATGSSPAVPPALRDLGDRLIVNDDVFAWESLPESVAVFGTGAIGLELGQALARLGVRVRVFGRSDRVGQLTDPDVSSMALAALRNDVPIRTQAHLHAVCRRGDAVEITFDDEAGERRVDTFAYLLAAVGRKPNLAELGLDASGLALDARGIPHYDRATLQCGTQPVFIAGDVDDDVPVLHEAADEGRIAGLNAARFPDVVPGLRRSPLTITFTDPQLAVAGRSFASLSDDNPVIGEVNFADQGRSRVMLQNRGLLRVYADPVTGRLLGAEMAGPRAEHLGHLLAWAHQQEMTIAEMLTMPFYHPVVEEGLRSALRDAAVKLAAIAAGAGPAPASSD